MWVAVEYVFFSIVFIFVGLVMISTGEADYIMLGFGFLAIATLMLLNVRSAKNREQEDVELERTRELGDRLFQDEQEKKKRW